MDFGTCGLGKWGAQQLMKMRGGKKWLVTYTAHYTSYMCSIEFKWCDGKGYATRPINQCTGRSPAQVVSLVRSKWYDVCLEKPPIDPAVWIKHSNGYFSKKYPLKFSKLKNQGPLIRNEAIPDLMVAFLGWNSNFKKLAQKE